MAYHPVNLALRFLLELAALAALASCGWQATGGPLRFVAAIGLSLVAAVRWGTFAMPGDPSRSGRAPVPVPGPLRLALELAIFGAATWALFAARAPSWAYAFAAVVIVHYVLSYDRVAWLLESGGST